MKRLLLAICALATIAVGVAVAQNVQQNLNGNEAWAVGQGGPGGPGVFTNAAGMKNGTIYISLPTGATITTVLSPNVGQLIATTAITTLNLSLPTNPYDGQTFAIACPNTTIGTVTLSGGTPALSTVGSPGFSCSGTGAVATSLSAAWTFIGSPANQWNRVR